jgi:hypothetical protein
MFSLTPPGKHIVGRYITTCRLAEASKNTTSFRYEVASALCKDTAEVLVTGNFVTVTRDEAKYNEIHTIDFYAMSKDDFDACIEAAYTAGRRAEANMNSWASLASTKSR